MTSPDPPLRFCSPGKSEILAGGDSFTEAERSIFRFLDQYLPTDWEVYFRAHLNGLRPDCILMSPSRGIIVLGIIHTWDPGLAANGGYRHVVDKCLRVKREIQDIYCPRLGGPARIGEVAAGVVAPTANSEFLCRILKAVSASVSGLSLIAGRDDFKTGDVRKVVPRALEMTDQGQLAAAIADLRHWLVEPAPSADTRYALELDQQQRQLATTRTERGYRRIRGAAGTGKSLVLASRAAELAGNQKDVLVVSFNITLTHYLMSLAARWPHPPGCLRTRVTWLHFHAWCKRVCDEAGRMSEYDALFAHRESGSTQWEGRSILDEKMPALAYKVLAEDPLEKVTRYDAILVDEGQDFLPQWWAALRLACRPGGEMVLVADLAQDIYETAYRWTEEAMVGSGFTGPWAELKRQYRIPRALAELSALFGRSHLPDSSSLDLPEYAQQELDLTSCTLRWVQTSREKAATVCAAEIELLPTVRDSANLAVADTVFITPTTAIGREVVSLLTARGYRVAHTFGIESDDRRQKLAFFLEDARIKATTIHSFKGWESRAVVLHVGDGSSRSARACFYAGLTRLRRHTEGSYLTVVCTNPGLERYGTLWPDYDYA